MRKERKKERKRERRRKEEEEEEEEEKEEREMQVNPGRARPSRATKAARNPGHSATCFWVFFFFLISLSSLMNIYF